MLRDKIDPRYTRVTHGGGPRPIDKNEETARYGMYCCPVFLELALVTPTADGKRYVEEFICDVRTHGGGPIAAATKAAALGQVLQRWFADQYRPAAGYGSQLEPFLDHFAENLKRQSRNDH